MSIFKRKIMYSDRIWIDLDHKFKDLVRAMRESQSQISIPLCVYHFRETGKQVIQLLRANGFRVYELTSLSELDAVSLQVWLSRADVLLMDSDLIEEHHIKGSLHGPQAGTSSFSLHLVERYPIPEPDDRVLAFCSKRRDIAPPIAYVALSEPWLTFLLGDRIKSLLQQMGLDKNECIEHTLVSNSIRKAQERMAKKIRRDYPHDSIDAWLAGNIQS